VTARPRRTTAGRIAVNATIVGDNPTGLGVYSTQLVRALDGIRDDLVVYTSCPGAFATLRSPVIPVTPAVRPERGLPGHCARLLWLQTAMRVAVRAGGLRGVLNTMPEAVLSARIPQVTVIHDLLPSLFPDQYARQQYYFRFFVPWVLRVSRAVVSDSEATKQEVLRHYALPPDKVRVVYPGFDAEVFHRPEATPPAPPGETPYVLYVGNLLPHKNVFRLLEAFASVRARRACRLVVRGDGRPAYIQTLRDRVAALAVVDAVSFIGYLPEDRLRDLYAGAAAFVFPSLGEGFGLPLLEAMACGTPVVTSDRSALPEVAGGAALTVDPTDTGALAAAIDRVLSDRAVRDGLRCRGFERVKTFAWPKTAEGISALLDESLA
jgi:glycosyltransferase involved in cell wall biosynthesis